MAWRQPHLHPRRRLRHITLLGTLANLVAIPLSTFIIMPLGLIFGVATLVNLETFIAPPFSLALKGLVYIAQSVSHWPMASFPIAAGAPWALSVITLSGLWIFLMQSRLRLAGLIQLATGFIGLFTPHSPHIFMDADGKALAYFDRETQTLWTTSLNQIAVVDSTGAKHRVLASSLGNCLRSSPDRDLLT